MLAVLTGLAALIACGFCIVQLFRGLRRARAVSVSALLVTAVTVVPGLLLYPVLSETTEPVDLSQTEFRTSVSCRKCHVAEYDNWHVTYHRTMTQEVAPERVLGDFSNTTIEIGGLACRMFQQGSRFFMELPEEQWEAKVLEAGKTPGEIESPPQKIHEVTRLVGSHNSQVYLTSRDAGRYLTLPLVWLVAEQRWISRPGSFLQPEELSLFGNDRLWNESCIFCHNTGGNPGLEPRTGTYNTQVEELGISCEACHGPGEDHIAANLNPVRRYFLHHDFAKSDRSDRTIVNPEKLSKELSLAVCGRCHGRRLPRNDQASLKEWFTTEGDTFIPGQELLEDRFRTMMPGHEGMEDYSEGMAPNFYWPDWTPRATAMEYLGLRLSECHTKGEMTCLSCHQMHGADRDAQLRFLDDPTNTRSQGDRTCLECHESFADNDRLRAHTHHESRSTGSRCLNCHMPYQAYGLLKAVRSHRIASPDATVSAKDRLPNACNQCHVDRSLAWTAEHLHDWYDQPMPSLTDDQTELSATLVELLGGHGLNRALAAWTLGWPTARQASPGPWSVPFLIRALDDSYPAVRLIAYQALRKFPEFSEFQFDYLALAKVRRNQIDLIERKWKERVAGDVSIPKGAFPVAPDGQPLTKEIDRLLREQDPSKLFVSE